MVYLMLSLVVLTFVFAVLGISTRISAMTGGKPHTAFWSHIFSGIAFMLLALSGFTIEPSLQGSARITTPLLCLLFFGLGYFLFRLGMTARKTTKNAGK